MTGKEVEALMGTPVVFAEMLGYTLLQPKIHDKWIRKMAFSEEDFTLQAHRNSYKTTCMIIAIAMRMILFPNEPNLLIRKDADSTSEVVRAVRRILLHPVSQDMSKAVNRKSIVLLKDKQDELQTNLVTDFGKKESQLLANGAQSFSITGKHFPRIYTDDIVTLKDRVSRPAREQTDLVYQELQNVRSKYSTLVNTGTPWHKNDTFRLMPEPEKWDVYTTGILSEEQIAVKKEGLTLSLFCANYELKHVADEDSYFTDPKFEKYPVIYDKSGKEINKAESVAHLDASYGGDHTSALTILAKGKGTLHVYGKVYKGHIQHSIGDIGMKLKEYNVGTIFMETNADKGYLATEFRKIWPSVREYAESMNKHIKISTYLVRDWSIVRFDPKTDTAYLGQIVEYQEGAEPDDAPDSISSLLREHFYGKVKAVRALGYRR